jgi:CheY-like chemotaxis protein
MTHRILLADDSVTIRKVVELTFSDEDFAIDSVGDGALALERARAVRPDIIISDVDMPGMDGYELCRKVKADPSLRTVPFLFLRGTFESFDEEKAGSSGADGSIVKPFESQEMIARVKAMIAGEAPASGAAPARPAGAPAAPAFPEAPGRRIANPFPVESPAPPPPAPPPVPGPAVCRQSEDFDFDFGDTFSERFGWPAAPSVAERPPEPTRETAAEMEEDLWSEVSLRDHASDLLEAPPTPGSGEWTGGGIRDLEEGEESPDETLFEEIPGPRSTPPIEPEPEAVRAIVSSLAAPLPPHREAHLAPGPAPLPPATRATQPAVDPAEIERIVAARMEAVVRQVLEPVVRELARTMIETVSWEVIPDLAEAMIRAEIDRIGQSTSTA